MKFYNNINYLIIPRWFFPNNLGDSICTTFLPELIKLSHIPKDLTVITYGEDFCQLFRDNPFVKEVIDNKDTDLFQSPEIWKSLAFNRQTNQGNIFSIYPEWHPSLWKTWNSNFNYFSSSKFINLISLNYLLQNPDLHSIVKSYNYEIDCRPIINDIDMPHKDKKYIGIVPDTKLANRSEPHPGCDGKGYRFGGEEGLNHWKKLVGILRQYAPIMEFSRSSLDLGDVHISNLPMKELAKAITNCKIGIMSDGGMHHMFTACRTQAILLGYQKINKPEFFKVQTDYHFPDLYQCKCPIKNLSGWRDLTKTCDLSCEKVDVDQLAEKIISKLLT